MKINNKVQKNNKIFFFLPLFLFLLAIFLRFPSLLRPFDSIYETELAFIGREAFKGGGFYATPWSQKPPGEVYVYGITYLLLGSKYWSFGVRIVLTFLCASAAFLIYKFGKKLFGVSVGFISALIFTVFFANYDIFWGTAAISEMLMPFFTIFGFYLFILSEEKNKRHFLFYAGLSLGISLLFKPSALYDFIPLVAYSILSKYIKLKKKNFNESLKIMISHWPLILGFCLPMSLFVLYITIIGKFSFFWDWTISKPLIYSRLKEKNPFQYIKNIFNRTHIVWILAYSSIFSSFIKKEPKRMLIYLWTFFIILTFIISGKYWNYYFIQLFLPVCILAAIFISDIFSLNRKIVNLFLILLVVITIVSLNSKYYLNIFRQYVSFLNGTITKNEYMYRISDGPYWKKIYETSVYLKENMKEKETVFSMEGPPGIYVFTDKFPPYKEFVYNQQFFENETIGFAFMNSFETYDGNRKLLLSKMKAEPPDYIVLVANSGDDVAYFFNKFPQFYSLVFTNYGFVEKFDDVFVYKLKQKPLIFPDKFVVDFNYIEKYYKAPQSEK